METLKEFTLIHGAFTPEQAREILMNLINGNIQYHGLQNIRSYEVKGTHHPGAADHIQDLKQLRDEILNLLNSSEDTNDRNIVIDSTIKIRLE